MGKLHQFQRRIAAFLIVTLISTNILGNMTTLAGILDMPLQEGRTSGFEGTGRSTDSQTTDPDATPSNESGIETVVARATLEFLETDQAKVDHDRVGMRLYRNGKPWYGARIRRTAMKDGEVSVSTPSNEEPDDEAFDEEIPLLWDGEGADPALDSEDMDAVDEAAFPADAVSVTGWQYETEPLPLKDTAGEDCVYELRPVASASDAFAILYQNEDGEYDDAAQADDSEHITEYYCVPFHDLSGELIMLDADGMEPESLPRWAQETWEKSAPTLTWSADGDAYPTCFADRIETELSLSDDGLTGTWQVRHALAVNPESQEPLYLFATLESLPEGFALYYQNRTAFADREDGAYDGGVMEVTLEPAVQNRLMMNLEHTKDIVGSITWEDEGNRYGLRPGTGILEGIVPEEIRGEVGIKEAEDVSQYINDDEIASPSVWVQRETEDEDENTWLFVVSDVPESMVSQELTDVDGYEISRVTPLDAGILNEDEEPVIYRAVLKTRQITIRNVLYKDTSEAPQESFSYEVYWKKKGESNTDWNKWTDPAQAQNGKITVTENSEITITVPASVDVKITDPTSADMDGRYTHFCASEQIVGAIEESTTDAVTVNFTYSEKLDNYIVNAEWNDNNNNGKHRPGKTAYADGITLYYEIGGVKAEVTEEAAKSVLGLTGEPVFVENQSMIKDGHWYHQLWNTLPKYDVNGSPITYSVGFPDYTGNYIKEEKTPETGVNAAVTYTHKTTFQANLEWKDAWNSTIRPDTDTIRQHFVLKRSVGDQETDIDEAGVQKLADLLNTNFRIVPDGSITISNLPEFEREQGNPYTYWLEPVGVWMPGSPEPADPSLNLSGVTYSTKLLNVGNFSNVPDKLHEGGTLTCTLNGQTEMQFTKEWRDGEDRTQRPTDGSFDLVRYPQDGKANYLTASPVVGYTKIDLDITPDEKVYNVKQTAGNENLLLPRFDENGYEYVYLAKENMASPLYKQHVGTVVKATGGAETWQESTEEYAQNGFIGNGETIRNCLEDDADLTVKKQWDAKAYQLLEADVVLEVTRQKRRLDADQKPMEADKEKPEAWEADTAFNALEKEVTLGTFREETSTFERKLEGLPKYDEYGYEYRYSVREKAVKDYRNSEEDLKEPSLSTVADNADGTGSFDMDNHHFRVHYEEMTDPDTSSKTVTITNKLIDAIDIKVKKVWSAPLSAATVDAEADDTSWVILQVNREAGGQNVTVGSVRFQWRLDASKNQVIFDKAWVCKTATNSLNEGSWTEVPDSAIVSMQGSDGTAISAETVIQSFGDGVQLEKYNPATGEAYRYTVEETGTSPAVESNYPGHLDTYETEKRIGADLSKYGLKRPIGVITNYMPGGSEWIEVRKEWKDDHAGDDIRGNVVVALQVYTRDKGWQFVKRPTETDLADEAYDYTQNIATTPGEYYTLTLNGDCNWFGRMKICNKSAVQTGKIKAEYYNQFRVLEIAVGGEADDYSKYTYQSWVNSADSQLTNPSWLPENLWAYYGTDLELGERNGDFAAPVGILQAAEYYYKVTTTSKDIPEKGYRDNYILTNTRIGMLDIQVEKQWIDAYVAQHPEVVVSLDRVKNKTSDLNMVPAPGFPYDLTLNNGNDYQTTCSNLPKYDEEGRLYEYSITEKELVITDTDGEVSVRAEVNDNKVDINIWVNHWEPGAESPTLTQKPVRYIAMVTPDSYTVGDHHTSDQASYRIQNKLEETLTTYTVHKVWKDDRREGMARPDLYVTLWRTWWTREAETGNWVKNKEMVPGYIDRQWDTTTDADHWHWICTFDNLPVYDSEGHHYAYSVQELLHSNGAGYKTYYLKPGALSRLIATGVDQERLWDVLRSQDGLNGALCQSDYEAQHKDDDAAYLNFEFAPQDGVIVNVPEDTVYKSGRKIFKLGDAGKLMREADMPTITLELLWRRLNDTDKTFQKVVGGEKPLIDARYLEKFPLAQISGENGTLRDIEPGDVGRIDIKPATKDGCSFTFGEFQKAGTDSTDMLHILPKFDSEGYEIEYAVSEAAINGEPIYGTDGTLLRDDFQWISENREFTFTNTVTETGEREVQAVKKWVTPYGTESYPEIQVQLNRAMKSWKNGQEVLLLYTIQKDLLKTYPGKFGFETSGAENEKTTFRYSNLPQYAPNGYEWYYWVSETKTNGYSVLNPVDTLIRGKGTMETVPMSDILAAEKALDDKSIQFQNSYPSTDDTDYIGISGTKNWEGDSDCEAETRWKPSKVVLKLYRTTDSSLPVITAENESIYLVPEAAATLVWDATEDTYLTEDTWKFRLDLGNDGKGESTTDGVIGLFKYAPDGKEYYYFIREFYRNSDGTLYEVPKSNDGSSGQKFVYTCSGTNEGKKADEHNSIGFKLVNTLDTVSLKAAKTWVDSDNFYGIRPDHGSVTLTVQRKTTGEPDTAWKDYTKPGSSDPLTLTVAVPSGNTGAATIKDLPRYGTDASGAIVEYQYRAVEENVPAGYTESEVHTGLDAAAKQYRSNITNTLEIQGVDGTKTLRAQKVWEDNKNQDGFRDNVTVEIELQRRGEGSTDDSAWTKADSRVLYPVEDRKPEEGVVTFSTETAGSQENAWVQWTNLAKYMPNTDTETNASDKAEYRIIEKTGGTGRTHYAQPKYTVASDSNIDGKLWTVTNTYQPEVEITFTKNWSGDENSLNDRPKSVTVTLYRKAETAAGEEAVRDAAGNVLTESVSATTEPKWTATFKNLYYQYDGQPAEYFVKETPMPGYTSQPDGVSGIFIPNPNVENGNQGQLSITNRMKTTSIAATKVWTSNENRPETVTFGLYRRVKAADEEAAEEYQLLSMAPLRTIPGDAEDEKARTVSYENLPTCRADGKPYEYLIWETGMTFRKADGSEQAVSMPNPTEVLAAADSSIVLSDIGYTVSLEHVTDVDDPEADGYHRTEEIKNRLHIAEIKVTKVWDDKDNQDGLRPDEINVSLYRSEQSGSEKAVPDAGETESLGTLVGTKTLEPTEEPSKWTTASWSNLPVKNPVTGATYDYRVAEEVPEYYTATIMESDSDDDSKTDGVVNLADGVTRNLTLTNRHAAAVMTVGVRKSWQDDADGVQSGRPESVTFKLWRKVGTADAESAVYQNDETVPEIAVNDSNGWNAEQAWTNLPVMEDGEKISYYVEETSGLDGRYMAVYKAGEQPATTVFGEAGVSGDETKKGDDSANNQIIQVSNYWTGREFYAKKLWDDDRNGSGNWDGIRPGTVTLRLYADGVAAERPDIVLDGSRNVNAEQSEACEQDSWLAVWKNLPRYDREVTDDTKRLIEYTVEEVDVPKDYAVEIATSADWHGVTSDGAVRVTNTHEPYTTSYTVRKYWTGDEDWKEDVRPDSIRMQLYMTDAAGAEQPVGDPVEVKAEENWEYTWDNLLKLQNKGTEEQPQSVEIYYYAKELDTAGYIAVASGSNAILNTMQTTGLRVTKEWEDTDDYYGMRPDQITVGLQRRLAEGRAWTTLPTAKAELEMTSEHDWGTVEFTGLPTHDKSDRPYQYRAVELEIDGSRVIDGEAAGYRVSYEHHPNVLTAHGTTEITNTLIAGALEVGKTLQSGVNREFGFQVTLTVNGEAKVYRGPYRKAAKEEDIQAAVPQTPGEDGIIAIQGGERFRIDGIPQGAVYTMTEQETAGYHLVEKTGDTGAIAADTVAGAEFTNRRRSGGGGGGGTTGGSTRPAELVKPVEPKPTEPAKPVDPLQPAEPINPTDPTQPGIPGLPNIPVTPDRRPELPPGTIVEIHAPGDPYGDPIYRGPYDPDRGFEGILPPGDYLMLTIGEDEVPLAQLLIHVDENGIPLGTLPKTGDTSGGIPAALLAAIFAGSAAGVVMLRRKEEEEGQS